MATKWTGDGPNSKQGTVKQVGHRMHDPILDSLKQYWETLRAGRLAPYRSEIDPRQFEHALENMFILEIVGEDTIRVRLAGMKLCEMMGMEVRGMSPRAFMMPEDRARFDNAVMEVVEKPAVTEFVMETIDYNGKSGTAYVLLMPLRSDFGEITRILGCISDSGESFEAPVRFRVTQSHSDLIEFKTDADGVGIPGFAESNAGFHHAKPRPSLSSIDGGKTAGEPVQSKKAPARRPNLKIVSTDD